MSKTIHLVGMGVLGSMTAWTLFQQKIPFTWEDNESRVVAWKASTGLIYPSGDELEQNQYKRWAAWIDHDMLWGTPPPWKGVAPVEAALGKGSFWFSSKLPPHGADYPVVGQAGPLCLGALPSYHMNPQQFVRETRTCFADKRVSEQPEKTMKIISHGYQRCAYYVWGWSVRVKIRFSPELLQLSTERPSLYLRKGRFQLSYANPIPGEPYHYAGSSMIAQKEIRSYLSEKKYATWEGLVRELAGTAVEDIERVEPLREGWRPDEKDGAMQIEKKEDLLIFPPMSGSGVRMAPYLCDQVLELL